MSNRLSFVFLAACLAAAPIAGAADSGGTTSTFIKPSMAGVPGTGKPVSYGQAVSDKLSVGIANLFLAPLEIHKNIVNTANETDRIAAGVTLGTLKGLLHMSGRLIAGFTDMISAPLPTEPLTTPRYVWQDYNVETRYGQLVRMKNTQ